MHKMQLQYISGSLRKRLGCEKIPKAAFNLIALFRSKAQIERLR